MRSQVWIVIAALAACGDDGGERRDEPDAVVQEDASSDAVEPDGAGDGAIDAAGDAEMGALVADGVFDSTLGMLCGLGFDPLAGEVHVYPCRNTQVHIFSVEGTLLRISPWSGELADDADVEIAEATYTIGTAAVAPGDHVYVNGEMAGVDLYAASGGGTVSVASDFGEGHVVGGSYHPTRGTFFVLQDRAATNEANTVGEINLATGALIQSFSTGAFDVSYGDLDVCNETGELYVASNVQPVITRYSPIGAVVGTLTLPAGVLPSGIALDGAGGAWLSSTNGNVVHVANVPCGAP